jgi:mannose-6-phosphate isomerase-like protein (cupin superfamily)
MTVRVWSCVAVLLVTGTSMVAQQQQPAPPAATPPAPRPSQQSAPPPAPAAAPRASAVVVTVTDQSGLSVQGVTVSVNGPVSRTVTTVANGTARLIGLRSGSYRFHFEKEGFITLERDVTIRAGAVPDMDVMLSPAPPPPPAPAPPPAPVQSAPTTDAPPGDPRFLSIVDFLDKNLISGRDPVKEDEIGCTASARTTLLQLRENGKEEARQDADEVIYVVAGEGRLRLGNRDVPLASSTVVVVPRGTVRGLARKGKNPLIVLSVVSGPPCTK